MLVSQIVPIGLTALWSMASPAAAAGKTTKSSKTSLFLPSRSTGSATDIWASVITESASTTEYYLACSTQWTSPDKCDGDFTGVTMTVAPSAVDVAFGKTTYECSAVKDGDGETLCATKTKSDAREGTITVQARETGDWMTDVTIIETATKKSSSGSKGSSKCKRDSTKSKRKKGKGKGGDGDGCSAGSKTALSVGGMVAAVGAVVGGVMML